MSTIRVGQIRPSATDGQVVTTVAGVTSWAGIPDALHYRRDDLVATTGDSEIVLAATPYQATLDIYRDGVLLPPSEYVEDPAGTFTLDVAATAGEIYTVRYWTTTAGPGATVLRKPPSGYIDVVLADAPLVWWRQRDASGTQTTDESGNARHGVYFDAPTLGGVGPVSDGGHVSYLGANDRAELALQAWMPSGDGNPMSVEIGIRTTATAGGVATRLREGSGDSGWAIRVDGTGKLQWFVRYGSGTDWVDLTSVSAVNDGAWHHIVCVAGAGNHEIWIDGVLDASTAKTGTPFGTGAPLRVGCSTGNSASYPAANFLVGDLSEFSWYATALTSARVLAHRNAFIA